MLQVRHFLELLGAVWVLLGTWSNNPRVSCCLWKDVLASGGLCCPPLRAAPLAARVFHSCPWDSRKYVWNLILK